MNFLLFALATVGLSNIIVHGSILDVVKLNGRSAREWLHATSWSKQLFSCYECTGFWAGIVCGLAVFPSNWHLFLIYGCAGSVLSKTYNDLSDWLISHITFEVEVGNE